ncbi:MAG: OmpH family outer membrane protein [Tannerella sp.]|jgi:outer membrane protein|nr:OmpH family outer membrane protein [Tannerella sp.]
MKRLIVLWLALLPLGLCAQEVKIAIINQMEIFNGMPEVSEVETKLAALNEQYERDLKVMTDEYQKKYTDYMAQQDSLTENIKLRRQQEIQDLDTRIQNYVPSARQDQERQAEELYAPVREKLQNAIKAVGDEKGYTVIINPQALLYVGSTVVDATPFVKTKLGLK